MLYVGCDQQCSVASSNHAKHIIKVQYQSVPDPKLAFQTWVGGGGAEGTQGRRAEGGGVN